MAIAAALTGCATSPAPPPIVETKIEVQRITIPAALLTCPPAPDVPINPKLQSAVADWIARSYIADSACREDLAEIAALQSQEEAK
ncbi:MAG TPA: hypothetical protein VMH92_03965 [Acidocella sp.]|nr:hypothetical protein [Acidocella sp.]